MPHPPVEQFRFTRREWLRGLQGVSEDDASRHLGPTNCISWTVGHLAWHEQRSWLQRPQGRIFYPKLNELFAYGTPMSAPSLREMAAIWHTVAKAADNFLNTVTTENVQSGLLLDGKSVGQTLGSALRRVTYHYWYHIGEIQAVRQMLGHSDLPEYVGDMEGEAPYRPE